MNMSTFLYFFVKKNSTSWCWGAKISTLYINLSFEDFLEVQFSPVGENVAV